MPQTLAVAVVDPLIASTASTPLRYALVPMRELILFATAAAFAIALSSNFLAVVHATSEADDHGPAGGG